MKTLCTILLFITFQSQAFASEDLLDYFYVGNVYINKISTRQIKKIDPIHKYVVASAFNTDGDSKKSRVGVFLVSKKTGIEVLDMFPLEKENKLIPIILKFSPDELIVGIYNGFTEIKKIKYLVNIEAKSKLVSRKELKYEEMPSELNIKKAIALSKNKKYIDALRILAPCLNVKPADKNSKVEDCLYNGEEIADKSFRHHLLTHYKNNKPKLRQTYGNYRVWFATLGIKIDNVKYAGTIYTHNYLITLKKLFPDSKYQDVFDYKLLERGVNDIKAVQKWIDSLKAYRSKYPDGRYIFNATVDLAHAYDNLWELLTPDSEESEDSPYRYSQYYSYFSSGDISKDLKNAEIYRNKALQLYRRLKMHGVPKGIKDEHELQELIVRMQMLKNRKHSHTYYILND